MSATATRSAAAAGPRSTRPSASTRRYFSGRPPYAYPGYHGYVRVVAITDVQRRKPGVRVRGLLDTARNGYRGRGRGDVSFRCDTDRRGRVQSVQLTPLFRTQ
jgi:hypothetical protein